jgi:hypothetical protein
VTFRVKVTDVKRFMVQGPKNTLTSNIKEKLLLLNALEKPQANDI